MFASIHSDYTLTDDLSLQAEDIFVQIELDRPLHRIRSWG